jgi:hypothetical protein
MESGILQHTGRIWGRLSITAVLLLACCVPTWASPLFDDDTILDISLSGPLGTISKQRQDDARIEHPFVLGIGGVDIPVMVRVRGHSRTHFCAFPPLRLRFHDPKTEETPFLGQAKLKLVTHCRNDKEHFENNLLDEYSAYRIFNLISDASYRVRLLRITYHDTDERHKDLDRPYYGFIIESDEELAARLGGSVAEIPGVVYSRLNEEQTARVNVFQYLIANSDWSMVTATGEEECCHNVDLVEKDGMLYPVPYDFDLAGIVHASYAKPPAELRIRSVTTRVYRGYCRSSIVAVGEALDAIVQIRNEIVAVAATTPSIGRADSMERAEFVDGFFAEAIDDPEKLLREFDQDCIGKR